MRFLSVALVLAVLLPVPVRAEDVVPPILTIPSGEHVDGRQSCLKLASFGLALLSMGAIVWLLKRRPGGFFFRGRSQSAIQVQETLSLGGKHYVAVLTYGGRRFLIGVTPQAITTIGEVEGNRQPLTKKGLSEVDISARG